MGGPASQSRFLEITLRSHAVYPDYIFNNIFYNPYSGHFSVIEIGRDSADNASSTKIVFYNNTLINPSIGDYVTLNDHEIRVKNNVIYGPGVVNNFSITSAGTSTNNALIGGDSQGSNGVDLTGYAPPRFLPIRHIMISGSRLARRSWLMALI